MIIITIDDIQKAFDDLIAEKKSRDEITSWAEDMQRAEGDRMLKYTPSHKEDVIWEGLKFLSGVDALGDTLDSYLYNTEDFIFYKHKYS